MQPPTQVLGMNPQKSKVLLIHALTTVQWPMIPQEKKERDVILVRQKEKLSRSHALEASDSSLLERKEVIRGQKRARRDRCVDLYVHMPAKACARTF